MGGGGGGAGGGGGGGGQSQLLAKWTGPHHTLDLPPSSQFLLSVEFLLKSHFSALDAESGWLKESFGTRGCRRNSAIDPIVSHHLLQIRGITFKQAFQRDASLRLLK